MKYIEGQDRYQLILFPDCVEDYISENNPVRVIDAFGCHSVACIFGGGLPYSLLSQLSYTPI